MHNSASAQLVVFCFNNHDSSFLIFFHRSCIQGFEGSQNVRITNNRIGPAGIGADKDDGKWADGVRMSDNLRVYT